MAKDSIEKQSELASVSSENTIISPEIETISLLSTGNGALSAEQTLAPQVLIEEKAEPNEQGQVAKSASLVMLGNLGSSVMGMARQIVVAATGSYVSAAFLSALVPVQAFYDLLVNGSVSGALIPTFTDYTAREKRDEMRRLVFTVVNLVCFIMLLAALIFLFFSPWIIDHMVAGYSADEKLLTLHFAQIAIFSLLALGPFAVLLSALYALKEFGWPAFATASYHVGIMIGALIGTWVGVRFHGRMGLSFGVLIGVVGELVLLLPGIRKQRLYYMFVLDLKHPALRRVLKLYAPLGLSFLMSTALVFFDQYLATRTPGNGADNFAAMRFATTLIQFPVGLVAAALSFAVLPNLSAHASAGNTERFKETLLFGFRVALLLMIPAAVGLIILRGPIVSLIFQHHHYTAHNADLTAIALQNYAYQLPFVAIDQLLIIAFYARKNTIIPVAVYAVGVLGYLAVALPFWQTVGMPALALANTAQAVVHAMVLLTALRLAIGSLGIRRMIPTVLKIFVAAAVMLAVAWGVQLLLGHLWPFNVDNIVGRLCVVVVAGGLASLVYLSGVLLLKVEEVGLVRRAVMAKLGRSG